MPRARAGLDRRRGEATREQMRAEAQLVAGSSAPAAAAMTATTTGPGRDGRSACGSWCAGETAAPYIEAAVVAQAAAESAQVLAGCRLDFGIAAGLRPVRSLTALDRQPGRRLAGQKVPYQMAQANAALTRNCRQIGATGSTWSMES
jgi:hypothetical protein